MLDEISPLVKEVLIKLASSKFNRNNPHRVQEYINSLIFKFKGCKILVSGNVRLISKLNLDEKVDWIKTVDDFILKL